MNSNERTDRQNNQAIEQAIHLALKDLRYGSIEIIIHNSKVVQIERKEKMRLSNDASSITR